MTHRARRSRARTGHRTATGPVTPTCSRDRWGRAETERTALGEALVMRRRTRVRFPPPPPTPVPPRRARPANRALRASPPPLATPPLTTSGSGGSVPRPRPRQPPPDVSPVLPVLVAVLELQRRLLVAQHEQHHREEHDARVEQGPPAPGQQCLPEDDRQHRQVHRVAHVPVRPDDDEVTGRHRWRGRPVGASETDERVGQHGDAAQDRYSRPDRDRRARGPRAGGGHRAQHAARAVDGVLGAFGVPAATAAWSRPRPRRSARYAVRSNTWSGLMTWVIAVPNADDGGSPLPGTDSSVLSSTTRVRSSCGRYTTRVW